MLKLQVTSAGAFSRPASIIMLLAAVIAPFVLLIVSGREPNSVPWYLLATGLLLLLSFIVGGFVMFARGASSGEDISIRPKNR
jgi:hypothetical protein